MSHKPITSAMDGVVSRPPRTELPADLLLRHCLSMGGTTGRGRLPVKVRLEKALGEDFARRLVSSLTATGRN
jgi:hypothetical protein